MNNDAIFNWFWFLCIVVPFGVIIWMLLIYAVIEFVKHFTRK